MDAMLSKLKRLFNRGERSSDPELSWLYPPMDPQDVAAWDRYWTEQVRHGLGPPLFDMFCDDRKLVKVMNNIGMKSVLCAGSGISQEPRALAEAGFEVVALDFSPQAVKIAREFEFPAEGFECFCEPGLRRPGGHVDYVVGDIQDSAVCPGPFDVIIERRTAQIFLNRDIGAVLGALAKRLGQDGILLSHCHDGAWKPPAEPRHFSKSWFRENGWTIWNGSPVRKPPGRVAWLFTSTG
jgi:SAM-dependent methyltransferase